MAVRFMLFRNGECSGQFGVRIAARPYAVVARFLPEGHVGAPEGEFPRGEDEGEPAALPGFEEHFLEAFRDADVDGALAASVFHKQIINIGELKAYLATQGVEIRIC